MSEVGKSDRGVDELDGPVPLGLEGRLRRLEEIVSALEADEVELERALELFEEGVGHVRQAEGILARTELRVEELLGDGAHGQTRPLRVEGE
jgi:exodeoxyribonuclease VII small subunit